MLGSINFSIVREYFAIESALAYSLIFTLREGGLLNVNSYLAYI